MAGSFVGRLEQLKQLEERVEPGRVVVLHGPPGVGKSRCADAFLKYEEEEPIWVNLSAATTRNEVISAIGEALQTDVAGDRTTLDALRRVRRTLENRGAALVLDDADGAEDVVATAKKLAGRSGSDGTRVIITARARLGGADVYDVFVPPLDLGPAVELFVARSSELSDVELSENDEDVRTLVDALDRLPYAIELAASRTRILSPKQMLTRLEDRFDILRSKKWETTEAMERALEWTWELLDRAERDLLRQIASLPGSLDADAIESIVRLDASRPILEILESLIQKNWLEALPASPDAERPQFSLLNTIRAFARTRGGSDDADARAADHFCSRAEALARSVTTPDGKSALVALDFDRTNIRWALHWFLDRDDPRAYRFLDALHWLGLLLGPVFLYRDDLGRLAELARRRNDAEHFASAASTLAQLALRSGELSVANDWAHNAVEAAAGATPAALADAECTLATVTGQRDPESALALLERARERVAGTSPLLLGRIEERLGYLHLRAPSLPSARDAFARALDEFGAAGARWLGADAEAGLAHVSQRQGRLQQATERFARVVEMRDFERLSDAHAGSLFNLARVLQTGGRLSEAAECLDAVELRWRKLGSDFLLPRVHTGRALLAIELGGDVHASLQLALEGSRRFGDRATEVTAAALQHLARFAAGEELDPESLRSVAEDLTPRDPELFASILAIELATAASRGSDTGEVEQRFERLASHLDQQDVFAADVVARLRTLGNGFVALARSKRTPDGHHSQSLVMEASTSFRQAVGASPSDDDEELLATLFGAHLRIVARALVDRLGRAGANAFVTKSADLHLLEVHSNCHWYRVDGGGAVDLAARKPIRLLLKTILQTHLDDPDAACSVEELIAAGWPGETMTFTSGRNRVYAAIRFLREHDMGELIETGDEGYRIARQVDVQVAPTTGLQV